MCHILKPLIGLRKVVRSLLSLLRLPTVAYMSRFLTVLCRLHKDSSVRINALIVGVIIKLNFRYLFFSYSEKNWLVMLNLRNIVSSRVPIDYMRRDSSDYLCNFLGIKLNLRQIFASPRRRTSSTSFVRKI